MKKFTIIKENISSRVNIDPEFEELQNELVTIIDNSTNSDDTELKLKTMNSYIDDIDTTIIGLINDSDVFDFYIKHRNQIDKVLVETNHFEISPSDLGTGTSIYDYIIKSTKVSIQENFKKMIKE
jgi:hypothetical protein